MKHVFILLFSLYVQVLTVCGMFGRLENLFLAGNAVGTLGAPGAALNNLTVLSLEENGLTNWDQILTLGSLHK